MWHKRLQNVAGVCRGMFFVQNGLKVHDGDWTDLGQNGPKQIQSAWVNLQKTTDHSSIFRIFDLIMGYGSGFSSIFRPKS